MNFDEATLHFMNNFYEVLNKNPSEILMFYKDGAKLNVSSPANTQETRISDYDQILPKGEHKIFRSNAQKIGNEVSGHCSGYIKVDNDNFLQSNEMIVYDPSTNPFKIIYYSINLSQMDPAIIPEEPKKQEMPAEVKKEVKKDTMVEKNVKEGPVLVDNPSDLMKSRTLLASNLPYNIKQSEVLLKFESFGKVTKYCATKGKMLIEYENPSDIYNAINCSLRLNGRNVNIKKMDVEFD